MDNRNYTATIQVQESTEEVFNAINNVRGWWSEEIEGRTEALNDEFTYQYRDIHRCKMKVAEMVPAKKIVWLVTDNHFSFTKDKTEWLGTRVVFDISRRANTTQLTFTHVGLVPACECYDACVNGWTQYISHSLQALITTGRGQPNTSKKSFTVYEVAARFDQLAKQEKWFEIQDELFADDVQSIEPANSSWLNNAEGKAMVRKKGEDWVKRIEAVHKTSTTEPIIAGNHFAVGRDVDITVRELGRIRINQIMLYEVNDGRIVSEQFFY